MAIKYSAEAISAAIACQAKTDVPAVVTLAQFDLESSCGKHEPVGSNNPFGIKATKGQPAVSAMTWEVIRGQSVRVSQSFAKYPSLAAAFEAHGALLNHPLYAEAIEAWKAGDLNGGIAAMAKHYATDPEYASKIESVIVNDSLSTIVQSASARDISTIGTVAVTKAAPANTPAQSEGIDMEKLVTGLFGNFGSTLSGLAAVGEFAPEVIADVGAAVPDIRNAVTAIAALVSDVEGGKFGNVATDATGALSAFGKILSDFGINHAAVAAAPAKLATTPSVETLKKTATK